MGPEAEHYPERLTWPALDGIRAVAVGAVVLSHTSLLFEGGFFGVDVFFVLSGFLITFLLLDEGGRTGHLSVRNFYARRALRLLPALGGMLALVIAFTLITGSNDGGSERLVVAIPAVLLYSANWLFALHHVGLGFLAHTWSLAIEEQFYLAWPFVVIALLSRRTLSPAVILWAALAVAIGRFGLSFVIMRGLDDWTLVRADGLLLGAFLALVLYEGNLSRLRVLRSGAMGWLVAAGMLVVMWVPYRFPAQAMFVGLRGGYLVVSALAMGIVAHTLLSPSSSLSLVLRLRPLRWLGRVSYGVYLFHFPIFQFAQIVIGPSWWRIPLEYGATAAVVVLSWFLIEQPALRLKRHFVVIAPAFPLGGHARNRHGQEGATSGK